MSEVSDNIESLPSAKRMKLDQSTNGTSKENEKSYDEKVIDEEYFDSYSDIEVHRTMIEDQVRTDAYRKAIMSNPSFIKDKVVCDVGCGSGILSMFCAQAGAKKVYAIDASAIAKQAEIVIKSNGFQDIITVFQGKAEEVELPEKVDVVISEWMGYMMLYETMLPSVLHIRDKWLKPGGKMFPCTASMHAALGEAAWIPDYEESTYDFWVSLHPMYGLNMSHMADQALKRYHSYAHVVTLPQSGVASLSTQLLTLDLNTVTAEELSTVTADFQLKAMGARRVNSIVVWFDVAFPCGAVLTTSPHHEETHWQTTVLPIQDGFVMQDAPFAGSLSISATKKRSLSIALRYSLGGAEEDTRRYMLDENCAELA